jgi:hypothetical protein
MMSWIVRRWLKWRDIADRRSFIQVQEINMARPLHIGRGFLPVFAAFLLAVCVSGCANLDAVKKFAALSSNAANHAALTRDYIAALDRRKQYQPPVFHAELDAQKVRREAQQASLDVLQQTMVGYMQALGGLTTGEIRTYDKSLKNLGTSLNKATLLTSDEKEAVAALSTLLARGVTTVYRQNEIKKLIRDGNRPLQDIIKATRNIVGRGIYADLQVESALVSRYYDNFMLAPYNPPEPVAMALAREAKAEALGRVDSRIKGAQAYDAVLEKLAQGHQYLHEHRDRIGNNELNQQFSPYIDELRYAYRTLLEITR